MKLNAGRATVPPGRGDMYAQSSFRGSLSATNTREENSIDRHRKSRQHTNVSTYYLVNIASKSTRTRSRVAKGACTHKTPPTNDSPPPAWTRLGRPPRKRKLSAPAPGCSRRLLTKLRSALITFTHRMIHAGRPSSTHKLRAQHPAHKPLWLAAPGRLRKAAGIPVLVPRPLAHDQAC